MSRHGDVVAPFGTEERTFRLGIGELRKIEETCDAGAPELLMRLAPLVRGLQGGLTFAQLLEAGLLGRWRIDDVRAVILQGLIGGGMEPTLAGVLVRAEFDDKLSLAHAPLAFLILQAAWSAPPEDLPGERPAAARKRPRRRSPTGERGSPT